MNRILNTALIICALCFILSINAQAENRIKVVTTISQIGDAAKIIGGKDIEVISLMGAGVDPHLYKASEGDVRKLSTADIILYNGINLEAKMIKILEKIGKQKKVIALGDQIEKEKLLDSIAYPGHYDPHIWFNIELWTEVTKSIRDVFIEYDPAHQEAYNKNFTKYLNDLIKLNNYVILRSDELVPTQRVLVTAHDAFRYFGKKYNFEVVGLQGLSTESEAGTRDIMELADFIAKKKIKAIFIESSVPIRNIQAVQEAVKSRGWDVAIGGELYSDAMGDAGTFKGTYIGMVTHNIDTIVEALK